MQLILAFFAGASAVHAYTMESHKQFMIKNVDALVLPGTYKSHMHSFFGSDAITNVKPTSAQLQTGCFTGDNANDLSVYWVPTLYYVKDDQYTEVPPSLFSTYYENINQAEIPFPQDFAAIAGNAAATTQGDVDDKNNGMSWWCENGPNDDGKEGGKFPTRTCTTRLQTILRFPDCVDPKNVTSYAYNSGSYGTKNYCPPSMQRIPRLRFSIRYDLRRIIPDGWEGTAPLQLSCGEIGDGYCMHGDFINGWFEDAAQNMLKDMPNPRDFFEVNGAHGTGATKADCVPADADPDNGTSDYKESVQMMNTKAARAGVRKSLAEKRVALVM